MRLRSARPWARAGRVRYALRTVLGEHAGTSRVVRLAVHGSFAPICSHARIAAPSRAATSLPSASALAASGRVCSRADTPSHASGRCCPGPSIGRRHPTSRTQGSRPGIQRESPARLSERCPKGANCRSVRSSHGSPMVSDLSAKPCAGEWPPAHPFLRALPRWNSVLRLRSTSTV